MLDDTVRDVLSTQDVQIGIRAGQVDLDLLKQLAAQDRTSKSAVLRRLIHEEARRRGLPIPHSELLPTVSQ